MEGRIPFRIAIVAIVVGLLALTSAALIAYGVYANQRNYEILKRDYLEQVAEATAREVARLPRAAGQLLRVERRRFESGDYAGREGVALAGALAAALQADADIHWVSFADSAGTMLPHTETQPCAPRSIESKAW